MVGIISLDSGDPMKGVIIFPSEQVRKLRADGVVGEGTGFGAGHRGLNLAIRAGVSHLMPLWLRLPICEMVIITAPVLEGGCEK